MLRINECRMESSYYEERTMIRKEIEINFPKLSNLEVSNLIDKIYNTKVKAVDEEDFRSRVFLLILAAAL
jgi:hypothetical protein